MLFNEELIEQINGAILNRNLKKNILLAKILLRDGVHHGIPHGHGCALRIRQALVRSLAHEFPTAGLKNQRS